MIATQPVQPAVVADVLADVAQAEVQLHLGIARLMVWLLVAGGGLLLIGGLAAMGNGIVGIGCVVLVGGVLCWGMASALTLLRDMCEMGEKRGIEITRRSPSGSAEV